MDEIIEAGLGTTVAGGIIYALSSIAGATALAATGTVLMPVGVIVLGLGVYNSMKAQSVANAAATAPK
jgi:hypothetical protein